DKRPPPCLGYEDLLTRPIQVAELGAGATAQELEQYQPDMVLLVEQESYLRDPFNQTLPHGYMAQLNSGSLWQQLEADFGQNNAMGMEFEAVLVMDFANVTEVFQRLRGVRNRLNRQGQEVLRVHLLPSQLMIGKILALLPSHLGKGGKKLKAIFCSKSKTEQQSMGKTSHDSAPVPMQVSYAAQKLARKMKGPHKRPVKRKQAPTERQELGEESSSVMRAHSRFKGWGKSQNCIRAQKVQMGQTMECKKIPVDAAALQRLNISDTTPATPGEDGSNALGPMVSSDSPSDSVDDMHEFDGAKVTLVNSTLVTAVAIDLEKRSQTF
ncbi:hypothetical protein GN958_ATG00813, partial [Phytophthora infestans]